MVVAVGGTIIVADVTAGAVIVNEAVVFVSSPLLVRLLPAAADAAASPTGALIVYEAQIGSVVLVSEELADTFIDDSISLTVSIEGTLSFIVVVIGIVVVVVVVVVDDDEVSLC